MADKISADYKTKDLYKYYKKKYKNPVDYKTFKALLEEFNLEILNMIIYHGVDYIMPGRLGSLRIRKKKNVQKLDNSNNVIHNYKINYKASKELWKEQYPNLTWEEIKKITNKPKIYHLNEHTDNYYFRWYWDKITCNVKNQSAYKFVPIRSKKREASKAWQEINDLKNIYYE